MAYYNNQQSMEDAYNKAGRQGSWESFQSQNKIGSDPYSTPQQTGGWGTPTPQPVSGWGPGSASLPPTQNTWTPKGTSYGLTGTNTEVNVGAAYNGGSGNTGWNGGFVPQSQGGSPVPNNGWSLGAMNTGNGGQTQASNKAYFPNEQAMEEAYNKAGRPGTWEQWKAQNAIGTAPTGGTPGPTGYQWPDAPKQTWDMPWASGQSKDQLDQTMRDYQAWQAQWYKAQADNQVSQWAWQNPLDQQQAYGRWAMEQDANQRANTEADRQLAMQTSTGYNPYARHGYTNNAGYSRPVRTIG